MPYNLYIAPDQPRYYVETAATATAPAVADTPTLRDLWHGFCFGLSRLTVTPCDRLEFTLGRCQPLPLSENDEYTLCITPQGVSVCGKTATGLLHGILTMMERIETDTENRLLLPCLTIHGQALVGIRMIHLCVFPETDFVFLHRFIRMAAALKYSHLILEFWGMLKLDALPELSWPQGFRKEEIRPLVREANDLGMQIVPMFNHLGHASASRSLQGKHVVLDQNPALQSLFSPDGWIWNIDNPTVHTLLKRVRDELCDLCGDGDYFFLGCDEAYLYGWEPERTAPLLAWLNELIDDVCARGRRPVLWADMLLNRERCHADGRYFCYANPAISEQLLAGLDRRAVLADWQYNVTEAPVVTTPYLIKQGFNTLICPWKEYNNVVACVDTLTQCGAYGLVVTTWHTLSSHYPVIDQAARLCWSPDKAYFSCRDVSPSTASLLRRVLPAATYADAGWAKIQVGTNVRYS